MIWFRYIVPLFLWTCCNSQNVCEEPPEIDFGEIVSDERTEHRNGDRIQYRCFPGYALEGPEWITCKGPEWTPAPKCLAPCTITKRQLEAKNLVLSGKQRRSLVVRNNQTLEFLCREGYVLSTPSIRKCIDGHMNLPSCISERGKNCSGSPAIENGDITTLSQKQYPSGSSVEFKCQRYYAMEGDNRSFCNNGNWTKVPVCLEPCVISLAETERQNISVKLSSNENKFQTLYLPHGDSIELSCKPGHVFVTDQSVFGFQCRGEPIVYPKCKDAACRVPPTVANADIIRGGRVVYKPGHQVKYQCHEGFEMSGSDTVTCGDKTWSQPPTCEDITCPPPNEISHGEIAGRLKERYIPSDTVQYQCDRGWILSGPVVVTCINKKWTKLPTCIDLKGNCGLPPAIQNGDVLNPLRANYPPGTTLQYKCQNFYLMIGSAEVRCVNGLWTEPPVCMEACTISEEDMAHNNIQMKWTNAPRLYSASGAVVEFSCKRFYRKDPLSPPFRTHCINGRVEYPRCIDVDPTSNCGVPPAIQNGDVLSPLRPSYPPGTTLQYKCQHLYLMTGSAEVRCVNGQWSEPPTCIEACTLSEEDMRRNNIRLKWSYAPKLYSTSGDVIEFLCRQNYRKAPSSPPFRTHCVNGRVEYPRCIQDQLPWDY